MSRWKCKLCPSEGLGGPKGWERHAKYEHGSKERLSAQVSFGFTGDYSSGKQRRYKVYDRPAVAQSGGLITSMPPIPNSGCVGIWL